jgi:type II secretory pathway pseudopilin PulG
VIQAENAKPFSGRRLSGTERQRGSALIAIVAAIVLFSVLAAALLPMISSSGEQTAMALLSEKAFFLAESGYRYAVSRYRHANELGFDENDALEQLDATAYTLSNGDRFSLDIYAYFFTTSGVTAAGQTTFTAHAPGSFPADELVVGNYGGQKIQLNDVVYTISSAAMVTGQNDQLTVSVDAGTPMPATGDKTPVYPVVISGGSGQTLSQGGVIEYQNGQGHMFPLRNGLVMVSGRALTYRFNNIGAHRLEDVREPDPYGEALTDLIIPANATILLAPYTRIESTGIAGGGEVETRRKITFYGAFSLKMPPQKVSYQETFDDGRSDLTNPAEQGNTAVGTQPGDSNPVLKVTSVDLGKSLSVLDTAVSQKTLADFHRSSQGYVSYDAQTKVGFFPEPDWERASFAAGLTFRLRPVNGGYNGYGISFLKSIVPGGSYGIPGTMVPPGTASERAIVLWQQTDGGQKAVWLAYKNIYRKPEDTTFSFDTGGQGWEPAASWILNAGAFDYSSVSSHVSSSLRYPSLVPLSAYPKITLFYSTSFATRVNPNDPNAINDLKKLRIWRPGVELPVQTAIIAGDVSSGDLKRLDISQFAGREIAIEFFFDATHADPNQEQKWSIDDVSIVYEWPIQNATLAVRLKEAAVIPFVQGGTAEIMQGDQIFGQNSGVSGVVIAPPILSSGSWAAGTAAGTLLLNELTINTWFSASEPLLVVGKGQLAQLNGALEETTARKVNIIKSYYASQRGYTPANAVATDKNSLPYPRLTSGQALKWPVQEEIEWTADQDYFRLIKWDGINASVSGVGAIQTLSTAEQNTVLRCYQPELQSPAYGSVFTAPELGVHAMGLATVATRVYYDDFGFQLFVANDNNLPSSFQQ